MTGLLTNRVALVTGAGNGIGRAASVKFAAEGAMVVVADIVRKDAEKTAQLIQGAGGKSLALTVDVAQPDSVRMMVGDAVRHFGKLDCAFNNAGVSGGQPGEDDWNEDIFDRSISVNIKGVMLCMKYEIEQMSRQGAGAIVNMASTAGLVGVGALSYTASKHAIVGMTKTIGALYASKNIRVNAICPGAVKTPMLERAIDRDPDMGKRLIASHPVNRCATPEEISEAAAWLLSDRSSYVIGHSLAIDGGFTIV